jgi:hypothetical protein
MDRLLDVRALLHIALCFILNLHLMQISLAFKLTEVVIVADVAFEKMMNNWPKALQYFEEICKS